MSNLITWTRFEGYQCSTRGDARFSAFNARLSDGRSIEEHYQCDVKGYDVGGTDWRKGKGKPPLIKYDGPNGLYNEYLKLWMQWAKENPELIKELYKHAQDNGNALADMFATTPVNQARALADILNTIYIIGPTMGSTHVTLLLAAKRLRDAQRAYMADRGNDALGQQVAEAARDLDEAIAASTALLHETSRGL